MAIDTAIIVLGMRIFHDGPGEELKGRVDTAVHLASNTGSRVVIFTGGFTNDSVDKSEALCMEEYAQNKYGNNGVEYILEERALDTIGNAVFSLPYVMDRPNIRRIYVVTSCYHTDRSMYIFRETFPGSIKVEAGDCFEVPGDKLEQERDRLKIAQSFFKMAKKSEENLEDLLYSTEMYKKD